MKPEVTAFFDEASNTVSYVVADVNAAGCAIVDSVMDYDAASGRTATASADKILAFVRGRGFNVAWILETHVHADHLSAAPYLKAETGARVGIGCNVTAVQREFGRLFNAGADFVHDGSQFDHLFENGEAFRVGGIDARVMETPGHTPACITYVIGDAAFVGDTLFMPDYGTARTDFPGGNAATLYRSIQKLFALPAETRLFMCHDYKAPGRDEYCWETTVAEQRAGNVHIHEGVSEAGFVAFREDRDSKLSMPALILPSVQVNMRSGEFPPAEANGIHYLKIPIDAI